MNKAERWSAVVREGMLHLPVPPKITVSDLEDVPWTFTVSDEGHFKFLCMRFAAADALRLSEWLRDMFTEQ